MADIASDKGIDSDDEATLEIMCRDMRAFGPRWTFDVSADDEVLIRCAWCGYLFRFRALQDVRDIARALGKHCGKS